jgi:hypothetical protein
VHLSSWLTGFKGEFASKLSMCLLLGAVIGVEREADHGRGHLRDVADLRREVGCRGIHSEKDRIWTLRAT